MSSTLHLVKELAKQEDGVLLDLSDLNKQTTAAQLARRTYYKLNLAGIVCTVAEDIASKVDQGCVAGSSWPSSVAGASVFLASQLMAHPRSLKEIEAVVGNKAATIKKVYRILHGSMDKLVDEKWLQRGGELFRLPPT